MSVFFKAHTPEGYIFKVLGELLHSNIKVGCFEISKQGIFLKAIDTNKSLCIDISLDADNFSHYFYDSNEKTCIGINLAHFKKMLKPIKKKDSIEFIKETDTSDTLHIRIFPKEGGKITTGTVKIQEIQNIDMELPTGYETYISIPLSDYQKMCKDMDAISQNIEIKSTTSSVCFTADVSCLYSRSILFGTCDSKDKIIYSQNFSSEQLNNLSRLSGLSTISSSNIKIYTRENLPILFKTNVGSLGKISVYIKSKEQIKEETDNDE